MHSAGASCAAHRLPIDEPTGRAGAKDLLDPATSTRVTHDVHRARTHRQNINGDISIASRGEYTADLAAEQKPAAMPVVGALLLEQKTSGIRTTHRDPEIGLKSPVPATSEREGRGAVRSAATCQWKMSTEVAEPGSRWP